MINITDSNDSFTITKSDVLILELKLSISSKREKWKELSDMLFNFGTNKETDNILVVTSEKFTFLKMLQKLSGLRDSGLV